LESKKSHLINNHLTAKPIITYAQLAYALLQDFVFLILLDCFYLLLLKNIIKIIFIRKYYENYTTLSFNKQPD
jgi:hypothetical protein